MTATLVLTAAPVATVQQLTSLLEAHGVSPQDDVAVATSSGSLSAGALSAGAYDLVLSVAAQAGHHTVQLLGLVAAALKPGAKLVVQEVRKMGFEQLGTRVCGPVRPLPPIPPLRSISKMLLLTTLLQPGSSEATLSKTLLLSGLAAAGAAPGGGLAATKPAWETGARASIALKRSAPSKGQATAAAATWKLAMEAEDEEELVDDEELLTEEDKQRPAPPPGEPQACLLTLAPPLRGLHALRRASGIARGCCWAPAPLFRAQHGPLPRCWPQILAPCCDRSHAGMLLLR
jgi:hypothetical protein